MALKHCSECGENVSDRAPACPHCGIPMRAAEVPAWRYIWLALVLLVVAVMGLGFALNGLASASVLSLVVLLALIALTLAFRYASAR